MVGIKKLGCLGVLSRKTSKNPQKDESYQEGFRTDPYIYFQLTFLHPPVRVTVGEVRYSIEIDVGGE